MVDEILLHESFIDMETLYYSYAKEKNVRYGVSENKSA